MKSVLTADWLLVRPSVTARCKARSWGWQKGCILISQKFDCFEIMSTGRQWPQNGHKCHRRRRGYVCVALRLAILRFSEYRFVLPLNVPKEFGRGTSGLCIPLGWKKWIRLTFWRRNYFFLILAHSVYKMWIIQEPNTLELRKKTAIWREKNGEYIPCLKYSVPIFVE